MKAPRIRRVFNLYDEKESENKSVVSLPIGLGVRRTREAAEDARTGTRAGNLREGTPRNAAEGGGRRARGAAGGHGTTEGRV